MESSPGKMVLWWFFRLVHIYFLFCVNSPWTAAIFSSMSDVRLFRKSTSVISLIILERQPVFGLQEISLIESVVWFIDQLHGTMLGLNARLSSQNWSHINLVSTPSLFTVHRSRGGGGGAGGGLLFLTFCVRDRRHAALDLYFLPVIWSSEETKIWNYRQIEMDVQIRRSQLKLRCLKRNAARLFLAPQRAFREWQWDLCGFLCCCCSD